MISGLTCSPGNAELPWDCPPVCRIRMHSISDPLGSAHTLLVADSTDRSDESGSTPCPLERGHPLQGAIVAPLHAKAGFRLKSRRSRS